MLLDYSMWAKQSRVVVPPQPPQAPVEIQHTQVPWLPSLSLFFCHLFFSWSFDPFFSSSISLLVVVLLCFPLFFYHLSSQFFLLPPFSLPNSFCLLFFSFFPILHRRSSLFVPFLDPISSCPFVLFSVLFWFQHLFSFFPLVFLLLLRF